MGETVTRGETLELLFRRVGGHPRPHILRSPNNSLEQLTTLTGEVDYPSRRERRIGCKSGEADAANLLHKCRGTDSSLLNYLLLTLPSVYICIYKKQKETCADAAKRLYIYKIKKKE